MRTPSLLLILGLLLSFFSPLKAAPGDTVVVHAMSYGSAQDTVIVFPPASEQYEKIYMMYRLKCNPAQNPACGEWDYLTYTFLYDLDDSSRYEIGRYITPYGIGLDLGDGFTWVYDVSDYRPLLTDSMRITAGNWQELLDLKFYFIEGTPPRDPISVKTLWSGGYNYGTSTPISDLLTPQTRYIDSNATDARLKIRTTGHGFGGNENCAEFCIKTHSWTLDGLTYFDEEVWRDDCGVNPVYPQGGTWVYNRTNWCPGAEVGTYNFEIGPFVTPGDSVTIGYDIENYTWNGDGTTPYWRIEGQVVTFGPPNFEHDVAVRDIIKPSLKDMHSRKNPVCSGPEIVIENTGGETLYQCIIEYGVVGGNPCYYEWNDTLKFLETANVSLPEFNWSGYDANDPRFYVKVSAPNYLTDEYAHNNYMEVQFDVPKVLPNTIELWFKANNAPQENELYLYNRDNDSLVFSRTTFDGNTIYKDTFTLDNGCYTLLLKDLDNDGIDWWANNDGSGYCAIKKYQETGFHENFERDFGSEIRYHFNVGTELGVDSSGIVCEVITAVDEEELLDANHNITFEVYPNPSTGNFTLDVMLPEKQAVKYTVYNLTGNAVLSEQLPLSDFFTRSIDLGGQAAGFYLLQLTAGDRVMTKKILLQR